MSNLQDPSAELLVAVYTNLYLSSCCSVAAGAFLVHEAAITWGEEVEYFWRRKLTGSSILYFLNKYTALAFQVVSLALYLPIFTDGSCNNTQRTLMGLEVLQYLTWAAFSALRTYAVSRNRFLLVLVLLLSLVPIGVNIHDVLQDQFYGFVDPIFGCVASETTTNEDVGRSIVISRTCLIVADCLLLILTLRNTPWRRLLPEIAGTRSLQGVLLRDGSIYFFILMALNTLHLAFSLTALFGTANEAIVTLYTEPFTAMLVGRFLVHLQESGTRTLRVESDDPLHLSSESIPSFVRVISLKADHPSQLQPVPLSGMSV